VSVVDHRRAMGSRALQAAIAASHNINRHKKTGVRAPVFLLV
jgi:hypothetical protein